MADTSKVADWAWKGFTVVLSVIIIPLAGWVWSTNVKVVELRNDLADAEEKITNQETQIKQAQENASSIVGLAKDVQYMQATLLRIETKVSQ